VPDGDKFDDVDQFHGSSSLLSTEKFAETEGLKSFTQINRKILEIVSHNNLLLMENLRDTVEDCNRQIKEKDDQIRYVSVRYDLRVAIRIVHIGSGDEFCIIFDDLSSNFHDFPDRITFWVIS